MHKDMMGLMVETIVNAAGNYAARHAEMYGSPIGHDYVFGPALADILRGARTLLNGECGRLDCGNMDARILRVAQEAELNEEEV